MTLKIRVRETNKSKLQGVSYKINCVYTTQAYPCPRLERGLGNGHGWLVMGVVSYRITKTDLPTGYVGRAKLRVFLHYCLIENTHRGPFLTNRSVWPRLSISHPFYQIHAFQMFLCSPFPFG